MFTLPPRPPKDYIIKDVTKGLQSSSQFTPFSQPRVTQTNLGKFCFPIEYKDDELPEKATVEIEPIIMEKMAKEAKALWVVDPGKDDYLLQDVYRKYSVIQDPKSFDPRYKPKEKVFSRSYKFELDCLEADRMEKFRAKCERDQAQFENAFQNLVDKQKEKEKPAIRVTFCNEEPPFWWKGHKIELDTTKAVARSADTSASLGSTTYRTSYVRWQEEPNLTAFVQDDPCRRKHDMHLVGQPFKTEACNWYYKTYPPPGISFRSKK